MDKVTIAEHKLAGTCLVCGNAVYKGRHSEADSVYDAAHLCEYHWLNGTLNNGIKYRAYLSPWIR